MKSYSTKSAALTIKSGAAALKTNSLYRSAAITAGFLIVGTAFVAATDHIPAKPVAHKVKLTASSTTPSPTPTPSKTTSTTAPVASAPIAAPAIYTASAVTNTTIPAPTTVTVDGQTLQPAQAQQVKQWFIQYGGFMDKLVGDFSQLASPTSSPSAQEAAFSDIVSDSTAGLGQPPVPNAVIQSDLTTSLIDARSGASDLEVWLSEAASPGGTTAQDALRQQGELEFTPGKNGVTTLTQDMSRL